jgi:hypothetical protein
MKKGEDFQKAVEEHGIEYWPIHECSICGYECGFIFNLMTNRCLQPVSYDRGCNCTRTYHIEPRTWEHVASLYNLNVNNPTVKKEYDEFWKFEEKTE